MRVRFQADADLDGRILRGLRRAAPEIDIRTAADAGLAGLKDPDVLRISAGSGRVLVSQDRRTMPAHFLRYLTAAVSPGVILLREAIPIAIAVEGSGRTDWYGFQSENAATRAERKLYEEKAW